MLTISDFINYNSLNIQYLVYQDFDFIFIFICRWKSFEGKQLSMFQCCNEIHSKGKIQYQKKMTKLKRRNRDSIRTWSTSKIAQYIFPFYLYYVELLIKTLTISLFQRSMITINNGSWMACSHKNPVQYIKKRIKGNKEKTTFLPSSDNKHTKI